MRSSDVEAAPIASGHRSCTAVGWRPVRSKLRWFTRDRQRTQWRSPSAGASRRLASATLRPDEHWNRSSRRRIRETNLDGPQRGNGASFTTGMSSHARARRRRLRGGFAARLRVRARCTGAPGAPDVRDYRSPIPRDRSRRSSGASWSRGPGFRIREYPVSQALAVSDQRPDQSKQLLLFWTLMVLRQKSPISSFVT